MSVLPDHQKMGYRLFRITDEIHGSDADFYQQIQQKKERNRMKSNKQTQNQELWGYHLI